MSIHSVQLSPPGTFHANHMHQNATLDTDFSPYFFIRLKTLAMHIAWLCFMMMKKENKMSDIIYSSWYSEMLLFWQMKQTIRHDKSVYERKNLSQYLVECQ